MMSTLKMKKSRVRVENLFWQLYRHKPLQGLNPCISKVFAAIKLQGYSWMQAALSTWLVQNCLWELVDHVSLRLHNGASLESATKCSDLVIQVSGEEFMTREKY